MLIDLFRIKFISINGAKKLYPKGICWKLNPGMNVIAGGTGLGKTTLVNATLFGLFGTIGKSSKQSKKRDIPIIDKDYFRYRLGWKEGQEHPYIIVEMEIGELDLQVKRDLITGKIVEIKLDNSIIKNQDYEQNVLKNLGLNHFKTELLHLIDHLLYAGEHRYLITWDNQIQNEVMTLLFKDPSEYQKVREIWDNAQSSDSQFRNLRWHMGTERNQLEKLIASSTLEDEGLDSQDEELRSVRERAEKQREYLFEKVSVEEGALLEIENELGILQQNYNELAWEIDENSNNDLDHKMAQAIISSPNSESTYAALVRMAKHPGKEMCPSCGTIPEQNSNRIQKVAQLIKKGCCPLCDSKYETQKDPARSQEKGTGTKGLEKKIIRITSTLKQKTANGERIRSRISVLKQDIHQADEILQKAREDEWKYKLETPVAPTSFLDIKRHAVKELEDRCSKEERLRDRLVIKLKGMMKSLNTSFLDIDEEVVECFSKFAGLFLDQKCEVTFDEDGDKSKRKGAQIDPPHSAFYPVVDGVLRKSPDTLSEAQGLFMDLAFRMALLDVWQKKTGKTGTLIVETPEGSVDIAYMSRVSALLVEFAKKGHTLIVTTNLNNYDFLPSLFSLTPKKERADRILNLLEFGDPNPIQEDFREQFSQIIEKTVSKG